MMDFFSIGVYFFIGSFLNVLIYRLPRDISLLKPSFCEGCLKNIRWWQNIPIFSFLFLKGKCFFCKMPIKKMLLFTEIFIFITSCFLHYYFQPYHWLYISIFYVFYCQFFIDLENFLLMDSLNIILLFLGIVYRVLFQEDLLDGFLGILAGGLFPGIIAWVFFKLKNQMGMGGGDIKLYAALGMFLGPYDIFLTIFYSSIVGIIFFIFGLIFKKITKEDPLPFGPSILLVAFVQIFLPSYVNYIF